MKTLKYYIKKNNNHIDTPSTISFGIHKDTFMKPYNMEKPVNDDWPNGIKLKFDSNKAEIWHIKNKRYI